LIVLDASAVVELLLGGARAEPVLPILERHEGALPLHRHPATPLLPRIWELKARLTAYDATYVALAEALVAPLATFDRRMTTLPGLDVVRLARG
jgi:predicted nucleic acid-binding protein